MSAVSQKRQEQDVKYKQEESTELKTDARKVDL